MTAKPKTEREWQIWHAGYKEGVARKPPPPVPHSKRGRPAKPKEPKPKRVVARCEATAGQGPRRCRGRAINVGQGDDHLVCKFHRWYPPKKGWWAGNG